MNELESYKEKTFEEIKHIDEFGGEYWEARELMNVLGYSKWGIFKKVINKAKITCEISNNKITDHFADDGKMVRIGSGAKRFQESYNLFRYAWAKLKKDNIKTEATACSTHYVVGKAIRETIEKLGGTMPENLPTPDKSIKELEKEQIPKLDTK